MPEWWDEKADRQRVEEAVEIWRKGHVFTEGKHIVTTGTVYAYGDAEVHVYNDATVAAYDSTIVKAFNIAMVIYPEERKIIYPAGWTIETHE